MTSAPQRKLLLIALLLIGALVLSACGDGDDAPVTDDTTDDTTDDAAAPEGATSDSGIAFGASMEEYQSALADMDPVTIITQTPGGEGTSVSARFERYYEAVEEWSGGQITFDVSFANAIAPPAEIDDAVIDRRLDLASTLPITEPDQYPANNALIDVTFHAQQTPVVQAMQLLGWTLETSYATPDIIDEFDRNGIELLLPIFQGGSGAMFCTQPRTALDDFRGAQSSASSRVHPDQLGSLGVTPVSVVFTEIFESLQRGVVDCATTSLQVGVLGGFIPVAPHITLDDEVGYAVGAGSLAINQDVWNDLPLTARQLLYDRLDVFIDHTLHGIWESVAEAVDEAHENDGEVGPFADDARQALQEANEQLLANTRSADGLADPEGFVDLVEESSERWHSIVTEELGYEDEVDYNDFAEWYDRDALDVSPYIERLFADVLLDHRPE